MRILKYTVVGLLILVGCFIPVASVSAEVTYTTHSAPAGIVPRNELTGPDGLIWYTDDSNNKVGRINADGSVSKFDVQMSSYAGNMINGADSNIWIALPLNNEVAKISPISGAVTTYSIPSRPERITLGPDGNIWYVGVSNGKVGKITPAGIATEYTTPDPDDAFYHINAGSDGNVWFSGRGSGKISKITTTGVITQYSLSDPGSWPMGVTLGKDGNVWFPLLVTSKIAKITPSGVITEYDMPTPLAGVLTLLSDPEGRLWFKEIYRSGFIGYTTLDGAITESESTYASSSGELFKGPDGRLWFYSFSSESFVSLAVAAPPGVNNPVQAEATPSVTMSKSLPSVRAQTTVARSPMSKALTVFARQSVIPELENPKPQEAAVSSDKNLETQTPAISQTTADIKSVSPQRPYWALGVIAFIALLIMVTSSKRKKV